MSEELTREALGTWIHEYCNTLTSSKAQAKFDELVNRIEADREAVRAETREEILKDHFKIGEYVEYQTIDRRWHIMEVTLKYGDGTSLLGDVRRPAKKRPMTDNELRAAFKASERSAQYVADRLKAATIRDIMEAYGLPTEVDE